MTERSEERERGDRERGGRGTNGPFGTLFGAAFGPVGAAVGSVVDANRVAFTFAVGAGVPGSTRRDDGSLEDAATIEIEDAREDAASDDDSGEDAGKAE